MSPRTRDSAPALDLTVVVCTYNRAALLQGTLDALRRQCVGAGYEWEIVVVDNNSTDTTKGVVERFSRVASAPVTYLFERQQGKSIALNSGVAAARGTLVAFTDDDCLPTPSWVSDLSHAFHRWHADGVGGRILPQWAAPPPPWLLAAPRLHDALALLTETEPRKVELGAREKMHGMRIWGSNMAFRRSVLLAVGPFDPRLGPVGNRKYVGEETDLVKRVVSAGGVVVFDPTPTVAHIVDRDRMVKRYFRRLAWQVAEGQARHTGLPAGWHVLGVHPFLVRMAARYGLQWARAGLRGHPQRFSRELEMWEHFGYLSGHVGEALRTGQYWAVGRR
jgi:glycosyltransferase involved in cell wall biosynthesis